MTATKRTRRTQEELIADLQAEIATIKAKAEREKTKKDPALRHVASALRAVDKALELSQDKVLRTALNEARLTLSSCLAASGVEVPNGGAGAKRVRRINSADADGLADQLLPYVQEHPGQRGEEIAAAFGMDSATVRGPMKQLIADGKVRTEGQRRGTTYHPVG